MNYAEIKYTDIANGTGVRTCLFVSGCTHHCRDCFQPETWAFDFGSLFTQEIEDEIIESLKPDYIEGLTLLGGEPFEPANQEGLAGLIRKFQTLRRQLPGKNLWCYTGYTLERDILPADGAAHTGFTAGMISAIDVLVDGEFIPEEKDISLLFRGSRNQRLIDVPKTLESGEITLWKQS